VTAPVATVLLGGTSKGNRDLNSGTPTHPDSPSVHVRSVFIVLKQQMSIEEIPASSYFLFEQSTGTLCNTKF
jgi:hypothetical protein